MKNLFVLLFLGAALLFVSCGDDCDKENPSVKLINNSADPVDIQIQTTGGNTENINNIETGQSSDSRSFAPGDVVFTISFKGNKEDKVYTLSVVYCTDYTVVIDADENVSSTSTQRD